MKTSSEFPRIRTHTSLLQAWRRSDRSGVGKVFALLLLLAVAVSGQESGRRSRQWIVKLADLPGNTREEQLVVAGQRFAAAQMAERGINIVDHLGRTGVLLVRSSDELWEEDLEAKLALVTGFAAAEPFDPRASNASQIPVDVGPGYRKGAPGGITPEPDGTEYPHYNSSIGYDGIANTGFRPPDPSGAAGPTVFIQGVNTQFTLSNKATGATIASASAATFYAPLGGLLSFSDPIVVFNEHTQRFAVGIVDFSTPASLCRFDLAISKTANPATFTAADWDFFRYNADDSSAGFDFADYPKMGYNGEGYVVSFNQFKDAFSYDHVAVLAVRNDGTSPGGIVVVPGGFNNFTLAPASTHDDLPGVDDPFWFVQAGTSSTVIQAIQMTNPFAVSPTFTFNNVTVNAYFDTQSPHQPGGQLTGNSNLGTRFYFTGLRTGGGATHLVAAHTSAKTSGNAFSEVRWYDLDVTGSPSLIQQGKIEGGTNIDTYFPDIDIAPDGTIGLGYMQSGSEAGQFISGYVTGRRADDAPGTLHVPAVAKLGTANLSPADRIGDYADVSVDPADGSFWYTFEYVGGTGSQAWSTWVHNFSVGPTFRVTSTAPAVGSIVGIAPTTYKIDFNAAYDIGSVSAADFTVNGTAADSFSVVDADTLTFTFAISPAVEGLVTMTIAAGVVTGDGSLPIDAFTGQFRLDTVPLTITGISPASGSVIVPGPGTQTIRVSFNEPVAPGTVQTADFLFNQGTVISAAPVGPGNTAVDVVLSGLVSEGTLTLTIGANAFTDVTGGPNPLGFSASYPVDIGTMLFPTPLTAVKPLGSLIYGGSISGGIGVAGDTDTFTLAVDSGQTVTVKVTPTTPLLQPSVQIRDPANTPIGSSTAGAANQNALLQTVFATGGGIYSIVVSGAGGTAGSYTVQVTLNAALENEGTIAGVTNGTPATAQDINGTFAALQPGIPGAQRGAVLGATDTVGYIATAVGAAFEDISGTGTVIAALTGVDDTATSIIPGFAFTFYGTSFSTYGVSSNGIITFGGTDSSLSNSDLTTTPTLATIAPFWDDLHIAGGLPGSNVFFQVSGSGANQHLTIQWNQIRFFGTVAAGDTLTFEVQLFADGRIQFNYQDLVSGTATGNNGGSATVGIKAAGTQGADRLLLAQNVTGGNAFVGTGKSTLLSPPDSGPDYYAFTLNAGETATVAVTSQSAGNLNLELRDGGDATLATGTGGSTNLTTVIRNFTAPTVGTYYARITGVSSVPYSLVVTRNTAFDAEDNNTFATAQDITPLSNVLGAISGSGDYQASTPTFTFEDISGTGTIIAALTGVDDTATSITPGFAFTFYGTSFSTFGVSSNGIITFGGADSSLSNSDLTTTPTLATIAAFWDDLHIAGGLAGSNVFFQVSGSGANQHLTIQWNEIRFFNEGTAGDILTFEVQLFADGRIQFNYQDLVSGTATGNNGGSATVGIKAAGTQGANRLLLAQNVTGGNAFVGTGKSTLVNLSANDDWYSFNVPLTGTPFVLTTRTPGDSSGGIANALDPHIELYDPAGTLVGAGTVLGDGRNESLSHTSLTSGTYRVRVIGEANTSGEYLLSVYSPPIIATNPVSQVVTIGNNATFTAAATGIPAPTVQWAVSTDNGATFNPFSGATSTTLTLPGVAFSMNQNRCRAVFTNASGTATSTAATLTVNRFPIPGTVIVSRYAMQAVKLPVTQITGAATDPDAGDTVSLVSVANGAHGTAQISGGYVFYMPSDQSADIFNYVIQDSRGANVMGSVTLTIKNDTTPSLNITGLTLQGDGSVAIDVSGFPGYTCGLQFKFDLADPVWTDIGPMTADQFGQGHFVDGPLPLGTTRGFYRLIHPAP